MSFSLTWPMPLIRPMNWTSLRTGISVTRMTRTIPLPSGAGRRRRSRPRRTTWSPPGPAGPPRSMARSSGRPTRLLILPRICSGVIEEFPSILISAIVPSGSPPGLPARAGRVRARTSAKTTSGARRHQARIRRSSGRRRHPWRGRSLHFAACHARSVPMMAPGAVPRRWAGGARRRSGVTDVPGTRPESSAASDVRDRVEGRGPGPSLGRSPQVSRGDVRGALYPRQRDAASPDVPDGNLKEIVGRPRPTARPGPRAGAGRPGRRTSTRPLRRRTDRPARPGRSGRARPRPPRPRPGSSCGCSGAGRRPRPRATARSDAPRDTAASRATGPPSRSWALAEASSADEGRHAPRVIRSDRTTRARRARQQGRQRPSATDGPSRPALMARPFEPGLDPVDQPSGEGLAVGRRGDPVERGDQAAVAPVVAVVEVVHQGPADDVAEVARRRPLGQRPGEVAEARQELHRPARRSSPPASPRGPPARPGSARRPAPWRPRPRASRRRPPRPDGPGSPGRPGPVRKSSSGIGFTARATASAGARLVGDPLGPSPEPGPVGLADARRASRPAPRPRPAPSGPLAELGDHRQEPRSSASTSGSPRLVSTRDPPPGKSPADGRSAPRRSGPRPPAGSPRPGPSRTAARTAVPLAPARAGPPCSGPPRSACRPPGGRPGHGGRSPSGPRRGRRGPGRPAAPPRSPGGPGPRRRPLRGPGCRAAGWCGGRLRSSPPAPLSPRERVGVRVVAGRVVSSRALLPMPPGDATALTPGPSPGGRGEAEGSTDIGHPRPVLPTTRQSTPRHVHRRPADRPGRAGRRGRRGR